ncbi:MAG: TolC family protein, partial [Gluconacetobacter diazotrophicus]|nr:TolC family protein [Gluconacetobacter diazotrophicus]
MRGASRNARAAGRTVAAGLLALLSACDLAPTYHAPTYLVPDSYRGSGVFARAVPQDDLGRGPWWERFGDPVLNGLEQQATAANPTLAAIAEQYTQARDLAAEARAGLFPQFNAGATTSDSRRSQGRPFPGTGGSENIAALNQIQASASWEPDFWDRIRNQTRVQKRLAQSDAAYLASARLILQAQLATDYMQLRGFDGAVAVYRQSIGFYETAVKITRLRQQGLIASGLDVARAENQLATAQALLTDTQANRAVLVHAIAVLAGADPITFALPEGSLAELQVAAVPPAVPS